MFVGWGMKYGMCGREYNPWWSEMEYGKACQEEDEGHSINHELSL